MRRFPIPRTLLVGIVLPAACRQSSNETPRSETAMLIEITSAAFQAGATIPKNYPGDGAERSPPLAWSEPPSGTKSLALTCGDPDTPEAPGFIGFSSICRARPVTWRRGYSQRNRRRRGQTREERFWQRRLRRPRAAQGEAAPLLLQALRLVPGVRATRRAAPDSDFGVRT
jgi:hypothetical protein